MTSQEKEFIALIRNLAPEDLQNLKVIMQRFEDPNALEIRERFIAEAEAGTFHQYSLAQYAQEFRNVV